MKRNLYLSGIVAGVALLALVYIVRAQGPGPQSATDTQAAVLGTGFTYQGQLTYGGVPVNGVCDFQFSLWDGAGSGSPPTGGTQIGSTQPQDNVSVTNGLFTVRLDFGNAFTGDARYLQIAVRCPAGSGVHTTLAPRQPLTAAPYALYALAAAPHHHLGQTWIGSGNPLVISGTFGGPDHAPLVLGNTNANGSGVYVERAGVAGAYVAEAGIAGVWVSHAGEYGVGVRRAGNPSFTSITYYHSGFAVDGAEGYGLYVGRTDMDGVHVWSAGGDGVYVRSAGEDGVDATTTSTLAYGGRFVNTGGGAGLYARSGDGNAADIELGSNSNTGTGDNGRIHSTAYGSSDLYLTSNDDVVIELDSNEDEEGIFRIDVSGLAVLQVNEGGDVHADGAYYCGNSINDAAGTLDETEIAACLIDDSPADFAEMLPAVKGLEPGDVLVIDPHGRLARSTRAYQASVVGVYSTQPSYIGSGAYWGQPGYVPLAVVGVVPVKASAENGPIRPGDLLVASSTPGHAMYCEGVEQCFGRTIGKALSRLDSGTGVIQVLVMLQ